MGLLRAFNEWRQGVSVSRENRMLTRITELKQSCIDVQEKVQKYMDNDKVMSARCATLTTDLEVEKGRTRRLAKEIDLLRESAVGGRQTDSDKKKDKKLESALKILLSCTKLLSGALLAQCQAAAKQEPDQLLHTTETRATLEDLPPEDLVLRWANFHLDAARRPEAESLGGLCRGDGLARDRPVGEQRAHDRDHHAAVRLRNARAVSSFFDAKSPRERRRRRHGAAVTRIVRVAHRAVAAERLERAHDAWLLRRDLRVPRIRAPVDVGPDDARVALRVGLVHVLDPVERIGIFGAVQRERHGAVGPARQPAPGDHAPPSAEQVRHESRPDDELAARPERDEVRVRQDVERVAERRAGRGPPGHEPTPAVGGNRRRTGAVLVPRGVVLESRH